jgi:hypothetical protein
VSVSLSRAAQDRRLLGATLDLYPRQAELLRSLEGDVRLHVWAIGRQSGKSTLGALAAVHNCTLRPDLDDMIPRGRVRYVLVAAPSEAQAREFVGLCAALVDASPALRSLADAKADQISFSLPSGAKTAIRAMAANSRSVRGMSASLVVLDEYGHFTDTAGPASDARMYAALEPSTRVFADKARVLVISTPFGESNEFHRLFTSAESGVLPSARAVCAPTWEVVPGLDEQWRQARRDELGEDIFRQELGAEFVASGGAFFDLRGVEFEDVPAAPSDGQHWVAGCDPAFHGDRFGVCLVGENVDAPGVLVVGAVDAIDPGGRLKSLDLRRGREDRTLEKVWKIIEPYHARIVTDQHQADAIRSFFGRLGASVHVVNLTGPMQTAAFVSTRSRLEDGSLKCWRHPQLIEDLRRVRAKSSESILLPRYAGGHCDTVSALALATYSLRHARGHVHGAPRLGLSDAFTSGAGEDFMTSRGRSKRRLGPAGEPAPGDVGEWNRRLSQPPPGWAKRAGILNEEF